MKSRALAKAGCPGQPNPRFRTRSLARPAIMIALAAGGFACMAAVAQDPKSPVATTPPGAESAPISGFSAWEATAKEFGGYRADTRPRNDVTMKFSFSTEVRELSIVGGQRVKQGEILVRARDAEIKAAVDQQRALADNTLEVLGAEKALELAEFKFNQLKSGKVFSPTEFEQLRIEAETAKVQRDQAKKNLEQQAFRLKQLEGQFERYYLEAPFDGVIEEVMVEVGKGVTEQDEVLRIVNTQKLWLDPYASTHETLQLGLKQGSPAWVLIDLPGEARVVRGNVLYVSPVADSVSQTRRVRVEIDNPQNWPAGTQALVRFSEPGGSFKTTISAKTSGRASE
ncbi:MAG: efflux RND transporter periplasmic adaptor subunit [Phycisphaerales bacterium]|nr:efflux RND transporter periplasmic adaptor subunit [Phycisphaerales bacterium]